MEPDVLRAFRNREARIARRDRTFRRVKTAAVVVLGVVATAVLGRLVWTMARIFLALGEL